MYKIAVLDDYQQVALTMADWSSVQQKAEITVFTDHLIYERDVIERLKDFDVVCVMRERTPLTQSILSALPKLKLIISTGAKNASINEDTVKKLGKTLWHTGYLNTGAPELTWGLLMALARHIPQEANNFKNGGWQQTIGTDLAGKTIGIVGLGRIGKQIAQYAKVFGLKVIAWSQNLTPKAAAESGAVCVSKKELFKNADFVTVHLILSDRSRGIIGRDELNAMKPTAYLINTSRGPLVDEEALINVLQQKSIAGAALDVFNIEPLPATHPLRKLDNLLATPHIGYVTENTYKLFYSDTVKAIETWLGQQ